MKTILLLAAAAAASLVTLTPTAFAQEPAGQVRVSYADLDLSSRDGQRVLDRRIRTAVEQACGPISSADPAGKNRVLECRTETLALARAQRDSAIAAVSRGSQVQFAGQR